MGVIIDRVINVAEAKQDTGVSFIRKTIIEVQSPNRAAMLNYLIRRDTKPRVPSTTAT